MQGVSKVMCARAHVCVCVCWGRDGNELALVSVQSVEKGQALVAIVFPLQVEEPEAHVGKQARSHPWQLTT